MDICLLNILMRILFEASIFIFLKIDKLIIPLAMLENNFLWYHNLLYLFKERRCENLKENFTTLLRERKQSVIYVSYTKRVIS